MASVLLDTSFLISLVDRKRRNHGVAKQYYRLMLETEIPIYFSAIAAAEFGIKQAITDLPLGHFHVLPFNITHGQEAAGLWNALGSRDPGDRRHVVRDDTKLIAQASHEAIEFICTEDASTLYKYCERLRNKGDIQTRAIKLQDGFDSSAFSNDGQRGLQLQP